MAEETKKQEVKKEDSKPSTSKESTPTVESSAIKNKDAEKITALMSENAKLKDFIVSQKKSSSKASSRRSGGSSIVGLQGLRGFGRK